MLFEAAIGDSYGAAYEYVKTEEYPGPNDLSKYRKHPRHNIPAGVYTDDTQMSIAVAEALLSQEEWTPLLLANKFVECYRRDPIDGYARGFQAFLGEVKTGKEFLAKIKPDSDKSGAAMRAFPLGFLPSVGQVLQYCRIQAAVTHNTPDGIHAACASALMAHFLLYDLGAKHEIGSFIEEYVPGKWTGIWQGQVRSKGWMSVQAAITAVVQYDSLSDILRACVDYTGDVDTVATIALGSASTSPQIAQDLPPALIWGLRDRPYGRTYLRKLDQQLYAGLTTNENSAQLL